MPEADIRSKLWICPSQTKRFVIECLVKTSWLELKIQSVPIEIDNLVARLKLKAMGVGIDVLTE